MHVLTYYMKMEAIDGPFPRLRSSGHDPVIEDGWIHRAYLLVYTIPYHTIHGDGTERVDVALVGILIKNACNWTIVLLLQSNPFS